MRKEGPNDITGLEHPELMRSDQALGQGQHSALLLMVPGKRT